MFRLSLVAALLVSFCSFGAQSVSSHPTKKKAKKTTLSSTGKATLGRNVSPTNPYLELGPFHLHCCIDKQDFRLARDRLLPEINNQLKINGLNVLSYENIESIAVEEWGKHYGYDEDFDCLSGDWVALFGGNGKTPCHFLKACFLSFMNRIFERNPYYVPENFHMPTTELTGIQGFLVQITPQLPLEIRSGRDSNAEGHVSVDKAFDALLEKIATPEFLIPYYTSYFPNAKKEFTEAYDLSKSSGASILMDIFSKIYTHRLTPEGQYWTMTQRPPIEEKIANLSERPVQLLHTINKQLQENGLIVLSEKELQALVRKQLMNDTRLSEEYDFSFPFNYYLPLNSGFLLLESSYATFIHNIFVMNLNFVPEDFLLPRTKVTGIQELLITLTPQLAQEIRNYKDENPDGPLPRDKVVNTITSINKDHATSEFIASIYRLFFSEKEIDFAPLYKKFQLERTHPDFFSKWSKDPATFLCQLYPRVIWTQDQLGLSLYNFNISDLPLFSRSIALCLKLSHHRGAWEKPSKRTPEKLRGDLLRSLFSIIYKQNLEPQQTS